MVRPQSIHCLVCGTENAGTSAVCRACGASLSTDPTRFVSALRPGTPLKRGQYAVGKVLGQGGFGITYLGSAAAARRVVAIKEFFPNSSTRQGLQVQASRLSQSDDFLSAKAKFLDEARILGQFHHPGIVAVYDVFEENNTAYMVMEFVRGHSLLELVDERGALPEREAVGYIIQVGLALEVVHAANLLHRDLKPDNIMLTDHDRAVLIDFGTARTFAAGMTGRMTTMLTPGYAPLEQYGQHVRFGPFTDVYALGATLYHLVTGTMPTDATDRVSGVILTSPHEVNPKVSVGVSDAIMGAMEIRVDRRPQTAAAFVAALQSALARAHPQPPAGPAAAPSPRAEARPPRMPAPAADPAATPPAPRRGAGPYDVEVDREEVRWPQRCACCYEPADSSLLVSHTGRDGPFFLFEETRGWEVPYCSTCLRHVRQQGTAPGLGRLIAGTVARGLIGGSAGFLVGLGGVAAQLIGAIRHADSLRKAVRPTCVALGPAVEFRGWERTRHSFTFLNQSYAEEFARQNDTQIAA